MKNFNLQSREKGLGNTFISPKFSCETIHDSGFYLKPVCYFIISI